LTFAPPQVLLENWRGTCGQGFNGFSAELLEKGDDVFDGIGGSRIDDSSHPRLFANIIRKVVEDG
jgi:hypothetical protein